MEAVGDGDSRIGEDDIVRRRAETLMRRLPLNALLVTRGASGMDLFERQGRKMRQTHIAALQRHEVFDVTGAGDTVGAVLTLAAASGCTLTDAARFANTAAGIVVGMVGTAVADAETLSRMLDGQASQARAKVLSRALAAPRVAEAQARGETVVFTSGAFAAFDASQLRRLQQARAQGDLLVVGITGAADERAEMLAALRVVDYVVPFTESTPDELIRRLRPDIVIAPVGRAAAP
jgi:D-beta-D-heptose 7-phosphate kinase/D-beta-D-heptose 1-phosphate adenosyltransferase